MQALELIAVMATEDDDDNGAADEAFEVVLQKVISGASLPSMRETAAAQAEPQSAIFAKLNDVGRSTRMPPAR